MKTARGDRDLLFRIVTACGSLSFLYDVMVAHWNRPIALCMLSVLLMVVERFPVEVDRLGFSLSFPIIYTLSVISGFPAASVITGVIVAISRLLRKRPLSSAAFDGASRVCAMTIASWGVDTLPWFHLYPHQYFRYWLIHLALSAILMIAVSNLLNLLFFSPRTPNQQLVRLVAKASVFTVVGSLLYDGFMIWLASDPKNTGSGSLGTFFFFMPLVAVTIVVHLISNLAHAKAGLEKLVNVSESINHQSDLPTVLEHIVQAANQLVRGNCGFLFVVQEDGSLIRQVGTASEASVEFHLSRGTGLAGFAAETGETILVENATRDSRFVPSETVSGTMALLLVPIHINDKVAGVISLGSKYTYGFRPSDLHMMTIFAAHAGVAMKNALYIEEREKRLLLEERNRLAREIHDGIAQDLASIVLLVESVRRNYSPEFVGSLSRIQDLLKKTVSTVRHSIYALRPEPYSHIGLIPALQSQLDEASQQHGFRTYLITDSGTRTLPTHIARVIYDTVSESVQNVVKHAHAKNVWVKVVISSEHVVLEIRDDGRGFHFGRAMLKAVENQSYGIENLNTLANDVGGTLEYITAPGDGTTVVLEIPLEECMPDDNPRLAL